MSIAAGYPGAWMAGSPSPVPGEGSGEGRRAWSATMPTQPPSRIRPIRELIAEWESIGRSAPAVRALRLVAERDPLISSLTHGGSSGTSPCTTLDELMEHMRRASGRQSREQAAEVIRVMLREAALDPLVPRFILQALLPGLISVAGRLRWGRGGDWDGADDFFADLLSTAWTVVHDWSGQDRRYAVLDLLSAVRCRMRRVLMRARDHARSTGSLNPALAQSLTAESETGVER